MSFCENLTLNNENSLPQPFELTIYARLAGICQFCYKCIGADIISLFVCPIYRWGFLSCENCKEKANERKNEWLKNEAYGDAKNLLNKTIKVILNDNTYEDGWELNIKTPFVQTIYNDNTISEKYVECIKHESDNHSNCYKCKTIWCQVSKLLEINDNEPKNEPKNEIENFMESKQIFTEINSIII